MKIIQEAQKKAAAPKTTQVPNVSLIVKEQMEIPKGSRAEMLQQLLGKTLNSTHPVLMLSGETKERIFAGDKSYDLQEFLKGYANEYDVVMIYNAANASFEFANNESREKFGSLNVELAEGGKNIVPTLLDESSVNAIQRTDRLCLEMIRRAIVKSKENKAFSKGIFVIVERAELLFVSNGKMSASNEKVHNPQMLGDLSRSMSLVDTLENRMVLIDRSGEVNNDSLLGEIAVEKVPSITEDDLGRIFQKYEVVSTPSLLNFAKGTSSKILIKFLTDNKGKSTDELLVGLKELKEKAIEEASGGVVKCSLDVLDKTQIAISEPEERMWESIKGLVHTNPDLISAGTLLVGPPGTGKTIRAQYLASSLGLPFIEINNTSSSGLAGVKEDRFRRAFEAAIQNKPCVLFMDEIDKALPKTEGSRMMDSNDSSQVAAYIQRMVGSKDMQGVIFIGGSNDPDQMNQALLRKGRFGLRIAVLPPKTTTEKVQVFNAVKNQLSAFRGTNFDYAFVQLLVQQMPENVTGADYQFLMQEAAREVSMSGVTMEQALLNLVTKTDFAKDDNYRKFIDIAIKLHTAPFKPWEQITEQEEQKPKSETELVAEWSGSVRQREQEVKEFWDKVAGLKAEEEDLLLKRISLNTQIQEATQLLENLNRDRNKIKLDDVAVQKKMAALEKSLKDLQEKLDKRKVELDKKEKDLEKRVNDARAVLEQTDEHNTRIREQASRADAQLARARTEAKIEFTRRAVLPAIAAGGVAFAGTSTAISLYKWLFPSEEEKIKLVDKQRERRQEIQAVFATLGIEPDSIYVLGDLRFKPKEGAIPYSRADVLSEKGYVLESKVGEMKYKISVGYTSPCTVQFSVDLLKRGSTDVVKTVLDKKIDNLSRSGLSEIVRMIDGESESVILGVKKAILGLGGTDINKAIEIDGVLFKPMQGNGDIRPGEWLRDSFFYNFTEEKFGLALKISLKPPHLVYDGNTVVTLDKIKDMIAQKKGREGKWSGNKKRRKKP